MEKNSLVAKRESGDLVSRTSVFDFCEGAVVWTETGISLQSLVDSHEEPFAVVGQDQCIRVANSSFEQCFNRGKQNVQGCECYKITRPGSTSCCSDNEACPYRKIFGEGKQGVCRHSYRNHRGRDVMLIVTGYPLHGPDGSLYAGLSVRSYGEERSTPPPGQGIPMGTSHVYRAFIEDLDLASSISTPVLLRGETGAGKSRAAFYIHSESDRALKPFMTLNCRIPMTVDRFETELFGKELSGYAVSAGKKNGLLEKAGSGTLFLDEVNEMPLEMQRKLVQVLETGEFRRVGGKWTRYAQARIICAENGDLPALVKQGKFLETLYSRIAGSIISVPSLRERLGDIPFLVQELMSEIGRRDQREYRVDPQAIDCLQRYDYPGNIGELKNILLHALSCSPDGTIGVEELRKSGGFMSDSPIARGIPDLSLSSRKIIYDSESRHIVMTLKQFDGNRSSAARALGISERTLYRKLKKYGIE